MIRYGIIGTGMMGVEHILNINSIDGAEVVAISDPHPPSIQAGVDAAAPLSNGGELATFATHTELLDSGLCDAVVVVSPNFTHHAIVTDIAPHDVHVMIEKPLCTTVDDALDLMTTFGPAPTMSDGSPKIVWVALEYRYMPPVAAMIDQVRTGDIGRPRMVSITEHRFPFLVKVGDWNRFSENTGGTLVEKCCHFFDLMHLITSENPVRVYASGAQDVNHLDETYDGRVPDILDNAYVIVDFASGARAMLDLCMFAEATFNQEELSVIGAKGKVESLIPEGTVRKGLRGTHDIGKVEVELVHDTSILHEGLHHGSSFVEHTRFCAAIRGEQEIEVTLADGMWAVATGAAAHRSIDEGRPVDITELVSPEAYAATGWPARKEAR